MSCEESEKAKETVDLYLSLSDIRLESHSAEDPLEVEEQLDDLLERVSLQFLKIQNCI